MLRIPRSLLTVNNGRHDWSDEDTREFLSALYHDNKDAITRAGARSAKYHDKHRRALPTLKPGDKVLVHVSVLGVNATKLSGIKANEVKRKSMPTWIGPFYVLSHPSENVYEIDLPRGMWVHRKVNVDKLKLATDLDCDKPPPVQVSRDGVAYAVESIVGHRKIGGRTFMLVNWVGGGYEPTWEPLANVSHLHILLTDYFKDTDVPTI